MDSSTIKKSQDKKKDKTVKGKSTGAGETVPAASAAAAPAESSTPSTSAPPSKKSKRSKNSSSTGQAAAASTSAAASVVVDNELDDLFKSAAAFALPPAPPVQPIKSKKSSLPPPPQSTSTLTAKKRKRSAPESAPVEIEVDSDVEEEDEEGEKLGDEIDAEDYEDEDVEQGDEDDNMTGGDTYEENEGSAEQQDEGEIPVHESLLKGAKKQKPAKPKALPKFVPENETKEQKDSRTIFVGNLGLEVAKTKSLLKSLHRHLLVSLPTAKIESTRFRSVAFAKPTEELPVETKEAEENRAKLRAKERVANWRNEQKEKDDGETDAPKEYLMPKEKRKVAFIKKEFHPEADHVNAYIVFAYPRPDRPTNVAPIMNPIEAASICAQHCNGTVFEGRTIRVDAVRAAASTATTARETSALWVAGADPRKTVFVGNLDFASKEEEIRVFFENLMVKERGAVPSEEEIPGAAGKWVVNVRMVRDRATGLGKGFAYVSLLDRDCTDEVLALPTEKLRFAKRTLRVQRCKSLPAKPKGSFKSAEEANSALPTGSIPASNAPLVKKQAPIKIEIPKGDPSLGDKLKDLSKEERKAAKSSDADRLKRRQAKKKSRVALSHAASKDKIHLEPMSSKKGKPGVGLKAKKSRTRSSHAASKRNQKKA